VVATSELRRNHGRRLLTMLPLAWPPKTQLTHLQRSPEAWHAATGSGHYAVSMLAEPLSTSLPVAHGYATMWPSRGAPLGPRRRVTAERLARASRLPGALACM
jgi:hypothetical protein